MTRLSWGCDDFRFRNVSEFMVADLTPSSVATPPKQNQGLLEVLTKTIIIIN
jgi:hypothetical protein